MSITEQHMQPRNALKQNETGRNSAASIQFYPLKALNVSKVF